MIPVHVPVMPEEILLYLAPSVPNPLVIDGTLGEGGHSERFLEACPAARVVGIDVDAVMASRARDRLARFADRFEVRVGWTDEVLADWSGPAPDAILMDLGISTFHYEGSGRGFSFSGDEPLDMRLDETSGRRAADIVNATGEDDLADLIYELGEERYSRRIARRIVEERRREPIVEARRLADIVVRAVPPQARHGRIHAATRTFQALRIAVNGELDRLRGILEAAPALLAENGRLGIISFHSLEDRMVKRAFRGMDVRYGGAFEVLTRKPVVPGEREARENPPSRSAKFRAVRRIPAGDAA